MSETQPNYRLRRAAVATLGLLAAGTSIKGVQAIAAPHPSAEVRMIENWQHSPDLHAYNGQIVLHAGTKLRAAPVMREDDPQLGQKSNVVHQVKPGNAVLTTDPVKYEDGKGNLWYGFSFASENPTGEKAKDIADRTMWVNASGLYEQTSSTGQPFIETIPNRTAAQSTELPVSLVHGQFVLENSQDVRPIALAQEVPEANLRGLELPQS